MITFERILCPIDLSNESAEALRYAVALTRAYDAKLYLCHSTEKSRVGAKEKINGTFANSIIQHLGHTDYAKVNWESLLVEGCHSPAEAITQEAAERRVDLIVMRSRRRPHAAALLGSTAEAICRTAPCPVLVTHPREREWVGKENGEISLRRILVAYDFSDDSERALSNALSLAQEYRAELHLLYVLPKPMNDGPEIAWVSSSAESIYNQALRRLQMVVTGDVHLWCKVVSLVRWGKAYQEVLAYTRENEIDLVCMGAHGKHFGAGALFGSNVDRVLRQAPCPVLVARSLKPSIG
jgi:nucleotide-binding universal stress UspA family protein